MGKVGRRLLSMGRKSFCFGLGLASIASACAQVPEQEVIAMVPLSFGPKHADIPSDAVLLAQIAEAEEFRLAANFDRNFDAVDPGEGIEHATFGQMAMDIKAPSPQVLFAVGDELFEYAFRVENGLGNGLKGRPGIRAGAQETPNMRRVHKSEFGGPDSFSCAECHSKGGPDGAGANTQNAYLRGNGNNARTADERNAPHLLGLGPIAALAIEMTGLLQAQRDAGIERALAASKARAEAGSAALKERENASSAAGANAISVALEAKGVSFGILLIAADGSVDASGLKGVDEDLVVRPFGWKGHQATLRGMIEESFRIHMGLLSMHEQEQLRDGKLDPINYGDGPWFDADRDGQHLELDSGMLTTMVGYLSQLEIPVVRPPKDPGLLARFGEGSLLFEEVGCAECHRPMLELGEPVLQLAPKELRYAASEAIAINVATDGEHPKIDPVFADRSSYRVRLFSDLRRHDMGPKLTSGYQQGPLGKSIFLTRPLWGLADTAPYLHDGRAPTIHDAILWHGGDAAQSRDLYTGLEAHEQHALLIFLLSLDREPTLVVP